MDKKYYIEIYYETGNSFGSQDETSRLELTWDNLDIAKENVKRIKEHYEWYDAKGSKHFYRPKKVPPKPKFVDSKYDFSLKLLTDDGNDWQISAFWCGYFETLYSAEIKEDKDRELSYVTKQGQWKI
jgi:hypothetical protein